MVKENTKTQNYLLREKKRKIDMTEIKFSKD